MKHKDLMSVTKIIPDENQPRKYFNAKKMAVLRHSIKKDGIITPVIIEPLKGDKLGKYRLIDGERRFRAALEEGLKEVPYIILETEDEADRLMQQFQIQEMHEGWTPAEKAMAIEKLAAEMDMTIVQVCQLLGMDKDQWRKYLGFSMIIDKQAYIRSEMPFEWSTHLLSLRNVVKKIYHEKFKKSFERSDEKAIENAILKRAKDGSLRRPNDIVKIKDAIIKNPDYIQKLIETNISPEAMFYESKAQGQHHLRNATIHAGYLSTHLAKFLAIGDVKPSAKDLEYFKLAAKTIKELIGRIED